MTSGQFSSFPIDKIWVDRDKRQRRELTNLDELFQSMNSIGQINPIVIKRDGELVAGERRWTAAKQGGWTNINVQFADQLSEVEFQQLELEENIKRMQLPWMDECKAIANYHSMRKRSDPEWTLEATADILGQAANTISEKIAVATAAEEGHARVIEAPKLSTAVNIVRRVNERKAADASKAAISAALKTPIVEKHVPLLNADFHEFVSAPPAETPLFNLIHCDFPYGVNADKHDQGQAAEMGGYEDSADVYFELLTTLKLAMDTVIAPSAHLVFWFSMDYYALTLDRLTSMGWKVNPFPLIWHKSDNTGILPDPNRGPRRTYETAFLASRGDRKLTARGAVANSFAWPGKDKSIHMSEKPVPMLKHFLSMLTDDLSIMLDPTCGSGNAVKAAEQLKAKYVLGIEKNSEFFQRAKDAYHDKAE